MGAAHPSREWFHHLPQLPLQVYPQQCFPSTHLSVRVCSSHPGAPGKLHMPLVYLVPSFWLFAGLGKGLKGSSVPAQEHTQIQNTKEPMEPQRLPAPESRPFLSTAPRGTSLCRSTARKSVRLYCPQLYSDQTLGNS